MRRTLFLVPIVLIGIGSAAGAGGIGLGASGVADIRRAKTRMEGLEVRYRENLRITESAVDGTNVLLQTYGKQQEQALRDVVLRMGEFLRRNSRKVRESQRLLVDGVEVTVGSVSSSTTLDADAVAWVRGVIGSAAAGTGVGVGVTAAVSTYGVASTGTAITGLSGAAAQSATMAWLGGGSLTAGGGGVALGTTALNVAVAGPVLLIGGFVVKEQGEKATTQAIKYKAEVEVAVAEMSTTRTRLAAVASRVHELSALLRQIVERGLASLDLLESEPFDSAAHADRFQNALNLVMAVRDVATTAVVDGAGELNEQTAGFSVKYRPMTEDTDE